MDAASARETPRREQRAQALEALKQMTNDEHCGVPPPYRSRLQTNSCHLQDSYDRVIRTKGQPDAWKMLWESSTPFLLDACAELGILSTTSITMAKSAFTETCGQPSYRPLVASSETISHSGMPRGMIEKGPYAFPSVDSQNDHLVNGTKRWRDPNAEHFPSPKRWHTALSHGTQVADHSTALVASRSSTPVKDVDAEIVHNEPPDVSLGGERPGGGRDTPGQNHETHSIPLLPEPGRERDSSSHIREIAAAAIQAVEPAPPSAQGKPALLQTSTAQAVPLSPMDHIVGTQADIPPEGPVANSAQDKVTTLEVDYWPARNQLETSRQQSDVLATQIFETDVRLQKRRLKLFKASPDLVVTILGELIEGDSDVVEVRLRL